MTRTCDRTVANDNRPTDKSSALKDQKRREVRSASSTSSSIRVEQLPVEAGYRRHDQEIR